MPNNGRITVCPYYRDEKNLSISCEDTYRRFRWKGQKEKWLDMYCDRDWKNCCFAQELNNLYESMEVGQMDSKYLELEHKLKASEKEKRKLSSLLGKAEKREKEKDEEIRNLRKRNRILEAFYLKNKTAMEDMHEQKERMQSEISTLVEIYEGRLAYLMANFTGGILDEIAMRKWLEKFEYAIQPENVMEGAVVAWRVHTRGIENERGAGELAAENESTGGAKIESAEEREKVSEQSL